MDFQSVRKKTDWKSILRFAKPLIISGQLLGEIHRRRVDLAQRLFARADLEAARLLIGQERGEVWREAERRGGGGAGDHLATGEEWEWVHGLGPGLAM